MSSRILRQARPAALPRTIAGAALPGGRVPRGAASPRAAAVEELLASVQAEAARMLEQARAEAEDLRQAAWQDGWRAGRDEAAGAVRQEAAGLLERVADLAAATRSEADALNAQFAAALPELALGIARRIVAAELALDPAAVVGVVRDVLAAAAAETVTQVRVAPTDHDMIAAAWSDLWAGRSSDAVRLVADPQMEPGGCVVEVAHGALDGRLPARFAAVARALGLPCADLTGDSHDA